jgi:hypothetical protein
MQSVMHLKGNGKMGIDFQNKPVINQLSSAVIGVLFVLVAISIIGYGAAVAIPKNILAPLHEFSPTLAYFLVDFVTIGIPLAVTFYFVAWIAERFVGINKYYMLAAPFVIFMLYGLIGNGISNSTVFFYSAITVAKILPVLVSVVLLSRSGKNEIGA